MEIETKNFGQIEIDEDKIINFNQEILGFEEYQEFTLIESEDESVFLWLQSINEPSLAFMLVNPFLFANDYEVDLSKDQLEKIEAGEDSEVYVYTLVVVEEETKALRTNLKAPVIINSDNKQAGQFVLKEDYPTKYYILKDGDKTAEMSG